MSPTIFREKGYRFYFLSNEEPRMHVHVACGKGEAKFWLEPIIALSTYAGLNQKMLTEIHRIVESHKDEIYQAWKKHFRKG